MGSGGPWTPNAYSAPMSNFTRLDPNRSGVAMMIRSPLAAREAPKVDGKGNGKVEKQAKPKAARKQARKQRLAPAL